MKTLGNLGWRGRKEGGREGGGREKDRGGRRRQGYREAPAAFPDDPCRETQLSSPPDSSLSVSSSSSSSPSLHRFTIHFSKTTLMKIYYLNCRLIQRWPHRSSPPTHLFLLMRGQECLPPSPSHRTAPLSVGNVYDTLELSAGGGCSE